MLLPQYDGAGQPLVLMILLLLVAVVGSTGWVSFSNLETARTRMVEGYRPGFRSEYNLLLVLTIS